MTKNPPGGATVGGGTVLRTKYDESRFLTLCEIVRQLGGRATSNPKKEAVLADVRPKYRFKLSSADAALDSFAYLLTCSTEAHCAAASPTWLTQRLVKLAVAWDFRDRSSSKSSPSSSSSPKDTALCGDAETSPDAYRDICNAAESIVRIVTSYHRATRTAERSALESRLVKLSFKKIYSRWLRCSAFLERVITLPVFYQEDVTLEKSKQREARAGAAAAPQSNNNSNNNNTLNSNNHHHHHPKHHHPHHHTTKEDEDGTEIALRIKILEESIGKQLGYQGYFLYVLRSLQALFSEISSNHYQGKELDDKAAENTAIALDALWHLTERSPRFRYFISIQPWGDNSSGDTISRNRLEFAEPYDPGDEQAAHQASRNANFRKLTKLAAVSGAVSSVLSCKFLKRVSKTCQFDLEFISDFSLRNGGSKPSQASLPLGDTSNIGNNPPNNIDNKTSANVASGTTNKDTTTTTATATTTTGQDFEKLDSVCDYLLPWMHMPPSATDDALTALAVLGFAPVARNKSTHAEMLIAAHLQKLNITKSRPYYIGTSRYPCFVCEVYISRIPGIIVHKGKGETMPCGMPAVEDKNGYCNAARDFVFTRITAIAAEELSSAMNEMKLIETPSSGEDDGEVDLFK